jgi:hypothetical protein
MPLPLVSVMVLNYNGVKYLKGCLSSVLECDYPNKEVLLIDNYSTDESVEYVRKNFPDVKIVQTYRNAGYSRAYNIAFSHGNGKYFVLLNNDVVVDSAWLNPLVEAAENDESIGALQPKILSMIEDGYFEYAGASGGLIDYLCYPFLRGRIFYDVEKDEGQYEDSVRLFWASGASLFLRADTLEKTGPLDEVFVHHMEEIDLCWRLNLVGYKLMVIPKSFIYHYEGATIKPFSFSKLYWNHRNNLFMMIKNLGRQRLVSTLIKRISLDMINIFYALLIRFDIRHAYAIVKAYVWLTFHFRMIWRERQVVQNFRTVEESEIIKLFFPKSIIFSYFVRKIKTYTGLKKLVE